MAKLSKDFAAGNLHPRENTIATGVLGAVNAEIIVATDGCSSFALDLRGTYNSTIECSGTLDGTNWTPIPVRAQNIAGVGYVAAIVSTIPVSYVGKVGPYRQVRARVTAHTSGGATATLVGSTAVLDDSLSGMVTTLVATTTGAAGAAVTLSVPAGGAGLRQYITYISIVRSASAALTAGAAPTVVTTTNLPNALAFTFGADAALQGVDKIIREDFAYPLAASAQNTACTIVCPLTTGVIWRVTVGYYLAP